MATVAELKAVLKDTLEKRGVLGLLKARIRAEVFSALDDESEPRPPLSHENLLINELIREYLEFNKYKYTASVLISESGQPLVPLDRQFLIRELNAFEESKDNTMIVCHLYPVLCPKSLAPRVGVYLYLQFEKLSFTSVSVTFCNSDYSPLKHVLSFVFYEPLLSKFFCR
uniref:Centrosomal protein 20 n=2 Tax=Ursus maritimus TaxID=29073 RepID=A0A452THQ3_URSMA